MGEPPKDERAGGGALSFAYTVAIVVFGICLAKLYLDQYIQIRELTARRVQVEEATRGVQLEFDRLAEEVDYLETLEGVERLARDKLRYIRPDEVILVPLREEDIPVRAGGGGS